MFCRNLQIPEPHGHMIRDLSRSDKPITCPKLLEIQCGYCHEKGHTTKYCGVLKEKNKMYSGGSLPKFGPLSDKKRIRVIDNDGFECVPCGLKPSVQDKVNKVHKVGGLMSMFGALNVEGDSDDENEKEKETTMLHATDADAHAHADADATDADDEATEAESITYQSNDEIRAILGITNRRWADDED
jgi:hypothetical protein